MPEHPHTPPSRGTPQPTSPSAPITSELASDPDMVELIALFVEELPARVDLLRSHLERRDLVELRRIAHQLKGACGGYGFPDVGRVAASLESLLEHAAPTDPETELNTIRGRVDELARMCSRVSVS